MTIDVTAMAPTTVAYAAFGSACFMLKAIDAAINSKMRHADGAGQ